MDDKNRARNMAKALRLAYSETDNRAEYVEYVQQTLQDIDASMAEMCWELIDGVLDVGVERSESNTGDL